MIWLAEVFCKDGHILQSLFECEVLQIFRKVVRRLYILRTCRKGFSVIAMLPEDEKPDVKSALVGVSLQIMNIRPESLPVVRKHICALAKEQYGDIFRGIAFSTIKNCPKSIDGFTLLSSPDLSDLRITGPPSL
jgi:hypothetical protein